MHQLASTQARAAVTFRTGRGRVAHTAMLGTLAIHGSRGLATLAETVGTRYSVIQAPMLGSATHKLAAAVAAAGALGSIGSAAMTPTQLRAEVAAFDALTQHHTDAMLPVNLNFFCHPHPNMRDAVTAAAARRAQQQLQVFYDELQLGPVPLPRPTPRPFHQPILDAVLDIHATRRSQHPSCVRASRTRCCMVVSFHFGLPEDDLLQPLLQTPGIVTAATATTQREAQYLSSRGVDVVVAQGIEAGGHRGSFEETPGTTGCGTVQLIEDVRHAFDHPPPHTPPSGHCDAATSPPLLVAAGGIMDAGDASRVLRAGADGVQVGTAFLAAQEAVIAPSYWRALTTASTGDTRHTRALSGGNARGIVNRYMRDMEGHERDLPPFPVMNSLTAALRLAGAAAAAAAASTSATASTSAVASSFAASTSATASTSAASVAMDDDGDDHLDGDGAAGDDDGDDHGAVAPSSTARESVTAGPEGVQGVNDFGAHWAGTGVSKLAAQRVPAATVLQGFLPAWD